MRWSPMALGALTLGLGVGAVAGLPPSTDPGAHRPLPLGLGAVAAAGVPPAPLGVYARTGLRLTDIVWTGRQFLYIENTTNRIAAAGPAGTPLTPFATLPRQVEETRCRLSPGAHGFAAGALYCHTPDNRIYRIAAGGALVTLLATLPTTARSDGALDFDTTGAFGYALLAATGRSGAATPRGGSVYAISGAGVVRRIGGYAAPGGADEVVVAPPGFGAAAGQAVLAVDAGRRGSLVAMDAQGHTRTLLTLPDGPNPLVALTAGSPPPTGGPPPGLYLTDTLSRNVFRVPATALRRYAGAVLVGSELRGLVWIVRPSGRGFTALPLAAGPAGQKYNLEGAVYIPG